ncbi:Tetratricopeptide repeat protein 1 [Mycena sanguinolenta]|uniref:Tetratricopeptide repeat protein 1 n=1 Tax=Mycena sanguinolenta TaxID=230812 RepID=A0A8H6XFY1_9AGAR|nr:Tetratricopeptide repeat protein 1 [Mycena sanguinolenta]
MACTCDRDATAMDLNDEAETTIAECLLAADEFKKEGNDHFRGQRWNEALVAYRAGLGRVPKRRKQEIQSEVRPEIDEDEDTPSSQEDRDETLKKDEVPMTLEEAGCAKVRAVLNANIGACFVKLDDHKQAVEACTEALLDDPNYVKALQRRAASNDKLNSWSSLTATQEDYTTLLKLLPASDPQIKEIERSQRLLKPRLEAAQKAETAEMLGKLKGIGNSILGNFGLSTDNFKFEPNGQGWLFDELREMISSRTRIERR